MGINKLIQLASLLAFFTVSSGQLPKILKQVRIAQLHFLKESQASKWGSQCYPLKDNI